MHGMDASPEKKTFALNDGFRPVQDQGFNAFGRGDML
jgi:hypothetical protein